VEGGVANFNLRGVSAINRNDLRAADQAFRRAYALDPNNAFALNNIGYVAERKATARRRNFSTTTHAMRVAPRALLDWRRADPQKV